MFPSPPCPASFSCVLGSRSPQYRFPGGESQADRAKSLEPLVFELERQTLPVLVVSHMSTLQVLMGFFYGSKRSVDSYYSLWIPQHTVLELIPHEYGWLHSTHDLSDAACEDEVGDAGEHEPTTGMARPGSLPGSPKHTPVPVELGAPVTEEVERFNLQVVQPSTHAASGGGGALGGASDVVAELRPFGALSALAMTQHDRSVSIPPTTQAPSPRPAHRTTAVVAVATAVVGGSSSSSSSSSASSASSFLHRKGGMGRSSGVTMLGETDFYAEGEEDQHGK